MINLIIALHCHIPYVRKRGIWPYGEEWIFEYMLESYIPLIIMLRELSFSEEKNLLSISISPILIEQLNDKYIQDGFTDFLDKKIKMTEKDIFDFSKKEWNNLHEVALSHLESLKNIKNTWNSLKRNIPDAISSLENSGLIEVGASSATHAVLPLLSKKSIEMQISVGIDTLKKRLGITPKYFWLPECAYKLGLEENLKTAEINYVFLGSSAMSGKNIFSPYKLGNTDIITIGRQWELSKKIWSTEAGFPGDPRYREFQKRFRRSGNRYWRNTGLRVTLAKKGTYDIKSGKQAIDEHVQEFIEILENYSTDNNGKTILISLDAEVFGHSWYEGIPWLKKVIMKIQENKNINLATPSKLFSEIQPDTLESIRPPTCSWGKDGDLKVWDRPAVSWMWDELGTMSSKYFDLEKKKILDKTYLAQLKRELLLSQASDWPFLVTSKNARIYGEKRFRMHSKSFWNIVDLIETDFKDFNFEMLTKKDNPFSFLG